MSDSRNTDQHVTDYGDHTMLEVVKISEGDDDSMPGDSDNQVQLPHNLVTWIIQCL